MAVVILALYYGFAKERWGAAVLAILAGAGLIAVIQSPETTVFPLARHLYDVALDSAGLR